MQDKNGSKQSATPKNVDEYIALAPEDVRATLEMIRAAIRKAAPGAVESIGYQMPNYKYLGKPLMAFAGWKKHCSLYAGYGIVNAFSEELADFTVEKSTIRFTPAKPLPAELVEKFVMYRVAEVERQVKG